MAGVARYLTAAFIVGHSLADAQSVATPRHWASATVGVGGNAIADPSERLKGTPQVLVAVGLAGGRPHAGVEVNAFLSREIDYFVGDCIGLSPRSCAASPFDLIGSSIGVVLPIRGDLSPASHSLHLGVGGYHVPRTTSRNGSLPAQTTVGFHAGIEGAAWRWQSRAVMLTGRAAFLPRLYERRAWMAHVGVGYRSDF
jgi:hypothetical protein